jgi:thimet oligopeptidase
VPSIVDLARTAADVTRQADTAIAEADGLVAAIVDTTDPTWATVMAPLDDVAAIMSRVGGSAVFMAYVHDDPDVRAAGHAAEERLQQWGIELMFRDDLYASVTAYAATDEASALSGERERMLRFTLRDLRRAGHELEPADRVALKTLQQTLVEHSIEFQRNVTEHEDGLIVRREDLAGLPDSYIEGLAAGPSEGSYTISMSYPDVVPFMDRAERRDLRQELDRRFSNRGGDRNRTLLQHTVTCRAQAAALLGHPSWAHHQLELRMAGTPDAVHTMYAGLTQPLTTAGTAERAVMQAMLAHDTGDDHAVIERWDWRFYHAKLEREKHGVDRAQIAEHFALEAVLDGMFALTGDVFGLTYAPADIPTWHPDVRSFEVRDRSTDEHIAHFYMDLFPREGTFGHAAAFTLVKGRRLPDGSYQHPVSAIVANFTKPRPGRPSLLQHAEVETLFHEFGHILHQVLTRAALTRFAGTAVERDFVEAPSQIMQHWTWQPEVLAKFARHHVTGEPLPTSLVDALVAARNLDVGLKTLRQVQHGWLDMQLHGPDAASLSLDDVTRAATEMTLVPHPEDTFWPGTFAHIHSGYDAGYYGYLWAEVIGDDMFRRFQEEGVLSPIVGAEYRREILEAGGTRDAGDLVRRFLGREPDNTAFLTKLGLR